MKVLLSVGILAVGVLLLAPTTQAQAMAGPLGDPGPAATRAFEPCSALGLPALRGRYAFTATAWQDLSQVNPGLPKGYAPVTIIGTFTINGAGEVTGNAFVNAGGLQMSAEFVNSKFGAPKADCTVPITLSMKINEFGEAITGPYSYVGVIVRGERTLEIDYMMMGMGPGAHVELDHARRLTGHQD